MTTVQEVQTIAEQERQRLARQVGYIQTKAAMDAAIAERATERQAREVAGRVQQQGQAARAQAEQETATRKAGIRKQTGAAEKQAQAVIGRAREARAREARKQVLPFTKPRDLGISSYIANVEAARQKAHQTGRDATDAVTRVRDDYFRQVDQWQAESLANIDKQQKGIQADIAKSLVTTKAEIAKQQADLNSGIKDWETQAIADITDFEKTNIQLNTGEWVQKDLFDKLPSDYQGLLKTAGVDKFNSQVQAEVADFQAKHIEIKPELWVEKTEWANLTPNQQTEVIETGQYTTIPTADQAFQQLKAEGKIPDNAILKSYDAKAGELTYAALKTSLSMAEIMEYWNQMNPTQQQYQTNFALGKKHYIKYKDFGDLTEDEKNTVIEFYTQSYLPYQTKDTQFFKELWEDQKVQLKDAAIGMIPIYGTIYNWDKMSPAWRGISIALDIASIIPFIRAAGQGIKAMTLGIKTRIAPIKTAATTLAKAEAAMTDGMTRILKQAYSIPTKIPGIAITNRSLAKSYTDMIKAQDELLKALGNEADLIAKGKVVSPKLKTAIVGYESKLRLAAEDFTTKLYTSNSQLRGIKDIPIRFDSPEIRHLMDRLPSEMVQNTKAAIAGIQLKSTNLNALVRAVDKAQAALKAAQTKYPTAPAKWVDLMYDLTKAQGRLSQAKMGAVQNLYQQLLKARNAGKGIEAARLQKQVAQALNSMEIEWGKLGFNTGGKVGVATTKPLSPTYSPSKAPTIGSRLPVSLAAAKIVTLLSTTGPDKLKEWVTPGGTSTPEVIAAATEVARTLPKVEGVTSPEIIAMTEIALRESIKASLEGKTLDEIKTNTINAIQPIVNEWVETEQVTKTEAKAMVSTAVKTAVKTATKLKITNKIKVHTDISEPSAAAKEGIYPKGTIVWRMGSLRGRNGEYKIIPPPYAMKKPITSRIPPKGMVKTKGTPQQTLTFMGGKVPFSNVSFDLGVTDGFIDVKSRVIKFTGHGQQTDVGQRIPGPTTGVTLAENTPLLQQLAKRPRIRQEAGIQTSKQPLGVARQAGPGGSPLTSAVYSDRKGERLARKHHRGWKRVY